MALPLCPKCVEGYEISGDPTGSIQEEYQNAYFTPGPTSSSSEQEEGKKRAVILLTDGYGLPLKNCKIIADKIAGQVGCDVWIPDYFQGRPLAKLDSMNTPDKADQKMTAWDWVKFIFVNGLPNIGAFISNRPSVVDARLASFFGLLKEKKGYEKIGAVGYCYGGATVIRLASTDFVHSVVVCHPATFSIEQVRAMQVPSSWACPEVDVFLSHQVRLDSEAALASRKGTPQAVEYEFIDYPGTQHGFASRPNVKYPEIVEAHEKALEQTISWFKKTL